MTYAGPGPEETHLWRVENVITTGSPLPLEMAVVTGEGDNTARWLEQVVMPHYDRLEVREAENQATAGALREILASLCQKAAPLSSYEEWLVRIAEELIENGIDIIELRRLREDQSRGFLRRNPAPVPTGPNYLKTASSAHLQQLRSIISNPSFIRKDGNPWPTAVIDTSAAEGQVKMFPADKSHQQFPPEMEKKLALRMWERQKNMGDQTADVLDALLHEWLLHSDDDGLATAKVDQILRMRGLKPKKSGDGVRGGYRPKQKQSIQQAVTHLAHLWISVDLTGRQFSDMPDRIRSRVITLTDLGEQWSHEGYFQLDRFTYRPGRAVAEFLQGSGKQIAIMHRQILAYDPYRRWREKRLGRYLSWVWRCEARQGQFAKNFRVSTLLQATGEEHSSRRYSETRKKLEDTLNRLEADGVIDYWENAPGEENYGDWRYEDWLRKTVTIEAPERIREHYKPLDRGSPHSLNDLTEVEKLGERLKEVRKNRGINQTVAADQIGISQPTLSNIERAATTRVKSSTARKIKDWITSGG